jgi:hypothetical protein
MENFGKPNAEIILSCFVCGHENRAAGDELCETCRALLDGGLNDAQAEIAYWQRRAFLAETRLEKIDICDCPMPVVDGDNACVICNRWLEKTLTKECEINDMYCRS